MDCYEIGRITSIGKCAQISKLCESVASEAYRKLGSKEIMQTWLDDNASEEVWQGRIEDGASAVYCASFENEMVGMVWAAALRGIHNTDGYIGGLYVSAPGQGIASALLDHAELRLAAWGCRSILAEVAESSPAIRLLSNRQYDVLGHHQGRHFKDASWAEMRRLLVQPTEPT